MLLSVHVPRVAADAARALVADIPLSFHLALSQFHM